MASSYPKQCPRIVIEKVTPQIDDGKYPVKRVSGEEVIVEASVFVDGHEDVRAVLMHRVAASKKWNQIDMTPLGNDRWQGRFCIDQAENYVYTVQGVLDSFGTWQKYVQKKATADQDISGDLLTGAELIKGAIGRAKGSDVQKLKNLVEAMVNGRDLKKTVSSALEEDLHEFMWCYRDQTSAVVYEKELMVCVEREKALFSTWYELFPRSWGSQPGMHGTFKDCEKLLPEISRMGFDVIYFPPIHPIGVTSRKGKDNSTTCKRDDVGCPWAIGGAEGGHKAVHSQLGSVKDFEAFVKKAAEFQIEVALDLALQCSPDHPYVKKHPQWFKWRPDGTVQFAENPPKKYEDVLPLNFETDDWQNLWGELKSIVDFWISKGVKIFRVDNPHTKPFVFWDWLIAETKKDNPDALFLAEAFTRPKVMSRLAKGGFSQSYTYFTWRNTKQEFTDYLTEITQTEMAEIFRPNFWPNTPDILPLHLQSGGRPSFMMRLVLAATLSSNYGIYGPAFELLVDDAVEGKEEYRDSEKYEIKSWDWNKEGNLKDLIARINQIRRQNPALQQTRNVHFCQISNDNLLAFYKTTPNLQDIIVVIINLNPYQPHSGWIDLPIRELGIPEDRSYLAEDLLSGDRYFWQGSSNFVELNPQVTPAHILKIRRHVQHEREFDYFM